MRRPLLIRTSLVLTLCATALYAQDVTKQSVSGVTNLARVESTIACGGATTPAAFTELKKMGYASVINLRVATEPGADIEAGASAAKAAGLNYVHLPFNAGSPDPTLVDNFLKAVTAPGNQPAFVHCASGNRAAALWMIKRIQVDKWDVDRATAEAQGLGMTSPAMKTFVMNYVGSHKH